MINRYTRLRRAALALACALLFAAPAAAQFDRAQLSGRIKDASAGAVPGATVTATNRQTQTATIAVSDITGFFTFPNASDKRTILVNTFDDSGMWGNSNFDRRHVFNFYYIYDLPFFKQQTGAVSRVLGGWQITGATFMRSGTPLWVTQSSDIAGIGDSNAQPWNQISDPSAGANGTFSVGTADQNLWFNPAAFARPATGTFGSAPRNAIYNPGQYQWDIALFKNVALRAKHSLQFRAEIFNFLNHPNWNGANGDPTSSLFGRVTTKDNSRRDIQLSFRYLF